MTPIARYMILCEDAHVNPVRPKCVNIDCLLSNIVSHEDPPYPLVHDQVCVYMVLTDCVGQGDGLLRLLYVDSEPAVELSRSPIHQLDFTGHSPLELLGVIFRMEQCLFPQPGAYSVQFWYNSEMVDERPLRLV